MPVAYKVTASMSSIRDLSYEALRDSVAQVFREGAGSRPDVLHIRYESADAVLKDYAGCDARFSWWLGPLLARREARALTVLRGIGGAPELIQRVNRRALLIEHVAGIPINTAAPVPGWSTFFERLYELVAAVHQRGVAHCDLRSPSNILIDEQGQPFVVDFVACVFRGGRWNLANRWLFGQFCRADRNAVAKLKSRVAPHLVTAQEKQNLGHTRRLDRVARALGKRIRAFSRALLTARRS